jgi:hypothetical protein
VASTNRGMRRGRSGKPGTGPTRCCPGARPECSKASRDTPAARFEPRLTIPTRGGSGIDSQPIEQSRSPCTDTSVPRELLRTWSSSEFSGHPPRRRPSRRRRSSHQQPAARGGWSCAHRLARMRPFASRRQTRLLMTTRTSVGGRAHTPASVRGKRASARPCRVLAQVVRSVRLAPVGGDDRIPRGSSSAPLRRRARGAIPSRPRGILGAMCGGRGQRPQSRSRSPSRTTGPRGRRACAGPSASREGASRGRPCRACRTRRRRAARCAGAPRRAPASRSVVTAAWSAGVPHAVPSQCSDPGSHAAPWWVKRKGS